MHGGAGALERTTVSPDVDARYRAALRAALACGGRILDEGGTALDAVAATVVCLEDDPLFNAGRGAVFSAEGRNELDASIMDGRSRAAGAVAGVVRTRNPILAARAVLEHSPHVLLAGDGADAFARSQGLVQVEPSWFFTAHRWRQLGAELRRSGLELPPPPAGVPSETGIEVDGHELGTVGAVAFDRHGNLAAATSTGGTTAKRFGRIGDSPLIGAGTYAQNGVGAVSTTGDGEAFIRAGAARAICARMELAGETALQATQTVIAEIGTLGGLGGAIVLDARGRPAWAMSTSAMHRGYLDDAGEGVVRIYADEG